MQKLLSILNPAGFFPAQTDTKPKITGSRRVVVHTRDSSRTVPKTRSGFALSSTMVFWISASLLALNLVLFVSYLFSVNAQANTGYTMKQLEKQIAEETAQNKKLLVQVSEANSISSVQDSVAENNFVPITAQDSLYVQVHQFSQK